MRVHNYLVKIAQGTKRLLSGLISIWTVRYGIVWTNLDKSSSNKGLEAFSGRARATSLEMVKVLKNPIAYIGLHWRFHISIY